MTRWGPSFAAYRPHFLIVFSADPERSRSGYRFDLAIEAIRRKASAETRATRKPPMCSTNTICPGRVPVRMDPVRPAAAKKFPGMALFRSLPRHDPQAAGPGATEPSPRTLVVFLVGDAPTGGIHKRASGQQLTSSPGLRRIGHPVPRRMLRAYRSSAPHFPDRSTHCRPDCKRGGHSAETLGAVSPWQLKRIGEGIESWFGTPLARGLNWKSVVDPATHWLRIGLRRASRCASSYRHARTCGRLK